MGLKFRGAFLASVLVVGLCGCFEGDPTKEQAILAPNTAAPIPSPPLERPDNPESQDEHRWLNETFGLHIRGVNVNGKFVSQTKNCFSLINAEGNVTQLSLLARWEGDSPIGGPLMFVFRENGAGENTSVASGHLRFTLNRTVSVDSPGIWLEFYPYRAPLVPAAISDVEVSIDVRFQIAPGAEGQAVKQGVCTEPPS